MSEPIELRILQGNGENIFTGNDKYVIPLYQRAYAWGSRQLKQLVEDISDFDSDKYYIGTLIVSRNGDTFEVIDGQQRLTSLYLLLTCLGIDIHENLSFARRDRSNYTLKNIAKVIRDDESLEKTMLEGTIIDGLETLKEEIRRCGVDRDALADRLGRVVLYRIEVPEHTDLNRYFEIMNTRGEQLEQHDIIKAQLMGYLEGKEPEDRLASDVFAKIWEACSDMDGYVQMNFESTALRDSIFGQDWSAYPGSFDDIASSDCWSSNVQGESMTLSDIMSPDFRVTRSISDKDDNKRRFESVIEFPYFLIHSLKVFAIINGLESSDGQKLIPELMNDKTLTVTFRRVLDFGLKDGQNLDRRSFSRDFIIHLLRMRFLFDKFIIKREYLDDNPEGEWSLKELHVSASGRYKKAYFKNTNFSRKGEWNQERNWRHVYNLMIQSCLRVSYTSPKVMHWITRMMAWLSVDYNWRDMKHGLFGMAENLARESVKRDFLYPEAENGYASGVETPHLVFNYLDYLLWKKDPDKTQFDFEFRNSVEHWYPRNPSNGTFDKWEDGVDRFGNLCLIQRNVNSKFSNMDPVSKKNTFKEMIAKGSLKLRLMAAATDDSATWMESGHIEHQKAMLGILMSDCGLTPQDLTQTTNKKS